MDHSELVAELPRIEKLTAAERLRIARERRALQLRLYDQRDKEFNAKRGKGASGDKKKKTTATNNRKKDHIRFVSSVMLLEAAARNDIEEVRKLLLTGVSPDSTNEDGLTALHQCCIDDSEEMMKLLLDFGANVNAEDSEKWTPLHAAATCGHLHLVKYLISKGANLLAVNADGNMPYDICEDELTLDYIESEMAKRGITQELIDQTRAATEHNMLMDLKALAAKGRSLEYRDHVGATPLHIASANGYLSVVEFLLDQHVATDVCDNDGWHPIHAAACWGHADILELLVQNGADLNAETKNHEKPYDICEDPELKARIAAIIAEQENKKMAEAAHRGTRRSGSTTAANTRTQSIRRTSIREKTMTAKKDARNEALIRLQKEHENFSENIADSKPTLTTSNGHDVVDGEDEAVAFAFAGLRKDTRGEINLSPSDRDRLQKQEANNNKNSSKRVAPPPPVAEMNSKNNSHSANGIPLSTDVKNRTHLVVPSQVLTSASHGSSESKIDIHVSVTINTSASGSVPSLSGVPCTLADLKRQRAHSRVLVAGNSGQVPQVPFTNPSTPFHNVLLFSHAESSSALVASSTKTFLPESTARTDNSEFLVLKGETQELVGTSMKSKKNCCVIS